MILSLEVSVVIPCLNEADTLGTVVDKAMRSMREAQIDGEVIVADNGSTDASRQIAIDHGARVVAVTQPGYGAALMGGIEAARGRYVIMGDADDSYDFLEVPRFVDRLREGYQLVQGCRFPAGGGTILPGAMPPLHRWFGNPVLSWLVRRMFRVPITDVYCGLRGFEKQLYDRLDMRCPGMEFATEMIIKTGMQRARIAQVPITLHPDGRKSHGPHLRTFRDGWRTLRLFMIYSPRWTFFVPGAIAIVVGLLLFMIALPQVRIFGVAFDVHTLLVGALGIIIGYQAILFAGLARSFAVREGMLPALKQEAQVHSKEKSWSMEWGLLGGAAIFATGALLILSVIAYWSWNGFGRLEYPKTMRLVVPGMLLCTLGIQTVFASLYWGVLNMHPPRTRYPARSDVTGGENERPTLN